MADNETRIISRILKDRNLKPALDRGISAEWFANPEAKEMWRAINEHYTKYGEVPTAAYMRETLFGCTILDVGDSLDALLDPFVEWRKKVLIEQAFQDASEFIDRNEHSEALSKFLQVVRDVEDIGLGTYDIDLTRTIDDRIAEYIALKELGGMRGLPTGFPTIDKATLGLQPQQLVTVVATPKAGKSTLMLKIARHMWDQGEVVLMISFEMSNSEQQARHDAMVAKIPHKRLLSGDMTDHDERMLRRTLRDMEGKQPFYLVADPTSTSTVTGIAAKIEQYKPTVVLVDGVYMMTDEETGERGTRLALTNITRSMKRLAQRMQLPIVISTQALAWKMQGKTLTSDAIGYSSSFFQDSDVIIGLQKMSDKEEDKNARVLRVMDSRNCPPVAVSVIWDWDTGQFEEIDDGYVDV